MQKLTLFLILFSTNVLSQNHLYFGEIIADKNFSCHDDLSRAYQEGNTYNGHSTELKLICQSKNEFEIRLYVAHRPSSSWDLFVLTFNNNAWKATKYSFNRGMEGFDTTNPIRVQNLRPICGFDSFFLKLKLNHVFTLPDQKVLTKENLVRDGNAYFLTFKAQNKFRNFHFENPNIYKEYFKNIAEFKNFDNIVFSFYKDLIKE